MLVGVPVIVLLNEISPNLRYMGISLLSFGLPISTMGFIIVPKILTVARMRQKASPTRRPANEANSNSEEAIRNEIIPASGAPRSPGPRVQVVTFD